MGSAFATQVSRASIGQVMTTVDRHAAMIGHYDHIVSILVHLTAPTAGSRLTLNHGGFVVRAVSNLAEAKAILADQCPHLAVIDMDRDDSTMPLGWLAASNT